MEFKSDVRIGQAVDLSKSTASGSVSSSSSSVSTKSKRKRRVLSFLQPLSLNTIILNVTIFILQIYLIANRFKSLNNLDNSLKTEPSQLPFTYHIDTVKNSIILNTFLVALALVITVLHVCISCFKIGIYSHDNFLLGRNFDPNNHLTNDSEKISTVLPVSSSSLVNDNNNRTLTKSSCFKKIPCWIMLPPVGACLHLISAFLIIFTEIHLNSKRIQLGQKPIGDIFSTKLDFLFGEPINRLKNLNLYDNQMSNLTLNDLN